MLMSSTFIFPTDVSKNPLKLLFTTMLAKRMYWMYFFFLLIVNVVLKTNYFGNKYIPVNCSFWILQILLFWIFRGVQNYVTIYFSTSKQSFLWVDQLKSFCEFVSVRENSVKMFVFRQHKQEFSTFTWKKIIIKIIWKILFSWNIICLRRFYLTMKISNFLWISIFFHD